MKKNNAMSRGRQIKFLVFDISVTGPNSSTSNTVPKKDNRNYSNAAVEQKARRIPAWNETNKIRQHNAERRKKNRSKTSKPNKKASLRG